MWHWIFVLGISWAEEDQRLGCANCRFTQNAGGTRSQAGIAVRRPHLETPLLHRKRHVDRNGGWEEKKEGQVQQEILGMDKGCHRQERYPFGLDGATQGRVTSDQGDHQKSDMTRRRQR